MLYNKIKKKFNLILVQEYLVMQLCKQQPASTHQIFFLPFLIIFVEDMNHNLHRLH